MDNEIISIPTMRPDIREYDLPKGLRGALEEYGFMRERFGYEAADAMPHYNKSKNLKRLITGMVLMTERGILRITSERLLSKQYVKTHMTYFVDLQGLFYFNGSPQITVAILKRAWVKGER